MRVPERDVAEMRRRVLARVAAGRHFAEWEQPRLFSSEVRAGFRPLR